MEGEMDINSAGADNSKSPKSPTKRRKSVGKLNDGEVTPTNSPSRRSKSPGKLGDRKSSSKSPGPHRKSLGKLSGDPLGTHEDEEGDGTAGRRRSKSPGKLKSPKASSSRSQSPGKLKSKLSRQGSKNRPTWWELGENEEEKEARELEESLRQGEEEEIHKRQEELRKIKERHEVEKQKSVQKGMVAQRLLEVAQPKERASKPIVLKSVRAQPLKLDLSKFEPPSYKKDVDQKALAKDTAKENFILKDLVTTGAKTDIKRLMRAFESVEVKHGKKVVKQGNEGKHLYVVQHGTVDFQVDNITVGTASAGGIFGDRNLLFQAPENATVVASSKDKGTTKLLRLHQETYRGIMQTTEEAKAEEIKEVKPPAEKESWMDKSKILQEREAIQKALRDHVGPDDLERIKVLGEGQFGEVWLVATKLPGVAVPHGKEKHEFALKCQSTAGGMENAIRGEIEVMGKLFHPFISTLYHAYEDDTSIDMLLGLIPGGELWDLVHKENEETGEWLSGIPESHAQFYSLVVADTLAFMHSQQYLFRDLKPENIMIDEKGYPIIVDFGFAKHCRNKTYTFCGTPNYVAPEIIKNAGHGPGADWWALGIVIYEMISGENPFFYDDMEQMALFQAICEEKGEPLKDVFSKGVRNLVDRLLIKDPADRLGSRTGQDVLDHSFYSGLNLSKLRSKKIAAPWIPGGAEAEVEATREREMEEELARLQKEEEERRRQRDEERRQKQQQEDELRKQRQLKEAEQRRREEVEIERLRIEEEESRQGKEEQARSRKQKELEEQEETRLEEEAELRQQQEEEERQTKSKLEEQRKEEERQRQIELKRQKEEKEEKEARERQLELERQREKEELRKQKEFEEEEERKRSEEEELRRRHEKEELQKELELEREREEGELKQQKRREERKKQKRAERKQLQAEEEHHRQMEHQKHEEEVSRKANANQDNDELSLEDLMEDEGTKYRNREMDKSWNSAVSPAGRQKKSARDLVSPVPKGYVRKNVDQWGREISPSSRASPRLQDELNKSVKKGLVASRLSTARENEKMGSSVPTLFTDFQL